MLLSSMKKMYRRDGNWTILTANCCVIPKAVKWMTSCHLLYTLWPLTWRKEKNLFCKSSKFIKTESAENQQFLSHYLWSIFPSRREGSCNKAKRRRVQRQNHALKPISLVWSKWNNISTFISSKHLVYGCNQALDSQTHWK